MEDKSLITTQAQKITPASVAETDSPQNSVKKYTNFDRKDSDKSKAEREMYNFEILLLNYRTIQNIIENKNLQDVYNVFSEKYVNIFTDHKDQKMDETFFGNFYQSNEYKTIYKGKTIDDLYFTATTFIFFYDDIMLGPEKFYSDNKAGFKYQPGDAVAIVELPKNSPLKNEWIGIYRKENGKWKMVEGSF